MSSIIKIVRNEAANCITFLGTSVPAYFNSCLSGEVDSVDTDLVNIINDIRSQGRPESFSEFSGLHYSRFRDVDDNSFANAQEVADYISEVGNVITSDLGTFNVHVESDYTGNKVTGSLRYPYKDIQTAVDNALDGQSIQLKGTFVITSEIVLPTNKSLYFYGNEDTVVKYASYNVANGNIFKHEGDGSNKSFTFQKIKFYNSGGYGLLLKKTEAVNIRNCQFYNCAWDGTQLNTVIDSSTSGLLGYDSTDTDLQAFYASNHASNGGAVRLEECRLPLIRESRSEGCLRAFRLQDCGINGGGFVIENRAVGNVESGFYLAVGSLGGCQNITVAVNYSAYNANNGLLCIGGINNKFSQNEVKGNWNAGLCAWGSANLTLRDCGLYDNNRSQYNGIGNVGDAKASVQLNDASSFLATSFSLNPNARFISEILDTQIHYTGLGSSSSKIGVFLNANMGSIPDSNKNIIKVDDVGFIGQDYAIDFSEVDLTNLRVSLGDNSYQSIGVKTVNDPLEGAYFELPFSNHSMNLNEVDCSVTNTGNVIIKEGVNGSVINPYSVNELRAEPYGSDIKVVLKDTNKIQFIVPVSGTSIDGSSVNSILSEALLQLNNLFTNTAGFSGSGGNPVTNFVMSGNDLILTLQDGTSFTVDVTTLGVDENKFVSSGQLNGSNLELTMNDSSIVTIDASNMINGSTLPARSNDWFIAYGNNSGDEVTSAGVISTIKDKQPFYNGDFLEKGEEYVWTHDDNGGYMLGIWSGAESVVAYNDIFNSVNWSTSFAFDKANGVVSGISSVGVDVASRYASGYAINNNTVLALSYDEDNYLKLYDISGDSRVLIGQSNTALAGTSQTIFFTGGNQPNAKFPVIVKRYAEWTLVHDFDNSETSIIDGLEEDSVIKSNISISPNEKFMVNINFQGRGSRFGIGYSGASSGNTNAHYDIDFNIIYSTAEQFTANDPNTEWTFNPNNTYYQSSLSGWWWRGGGNAGMISLRYNSDNSLELWSEDDSELIATKDVNLDGNPIHFYFGVNENTTSEYMPSISKQTLGQGSQPITTFAPDVSDQSFDITEGVAFDIQIALDANSDIVNQYLEFDAPSWAALNQATGQFVGTAPEYNGSTDSYVISCRAYNAAGGASQPFTVTLNVQEVVYTNTKSLRFQDGVSSFLGGNAALVTSLERSSNGSGSADAWSISLWIKGSTSNSGQTIFYFGNNDVVNNGYIELKQTNHNGLKRLRLRYGSNVNHIQLTTPSGSINPSSWQHILVTYDGEETGVASGSMSTYYGAFNIYIDGVLQTNSNTHNNNGYSGSIVGQNFRFGRFVSGTYPKGMLYNQMAIWDNDQSANISDIYNGGNTQDLSLLTEAPTHYYELENSVTLVQDLIGNADLVGYSFSSADLVSDAPPTS